MRPPAYIKPHLSVEKMFRWLQEAPDEAAHKRRMAIWLTATGKVHAHKVADIIGVSVNSVWMWIRQYNTAGPDGLQRKGRGGRRWGFLSIEDETKIIKPFIQLLRSGKAPKTAQIRKVFEKKLGRKVSISYIYRLLSKYGWSKMIAQSKNASKDKNEDTFQKLSQPWQRKQ